MSPFTGSTPRTARWQHLRLSIDRGVATVTLARPAKLNALTFGAYADLRDLLAELSRERSVRALVLDGEGRGFCSGGDVDEIIGATLSLDTAQLLDFNRMTGQVVRALRECPFPVVAALHGVAAGAGAVLALAADFRIADPTTRFAFLFTRVGLSGGDMGAAYLLPGSSASATPPGCSCSANPSTPPRPSASACCRSSPRRAGRGSGRRSSPAGSPTAPRSPSPRPRRCSPPSSTCRSRPRSNSTRPPRRSS